MSRRRKSRQGPKILRQVERTVDRFVDTQPAPGSQATGITEDIAQRGPGAPPSVPRVYSIPDSVPGTLRLVVGWPSHHTRPLWATHPSTDLAVATEPPNPDTIYTHRPLEVKGLCPLLYVNFADTAP